MSDTKTQELIGKILTGSEPRDAIHIAVVPMLAGHDLAPGDGVGIDLGMIYDHVQPYVGIVDPYLGGHVARGQWCYVFLFPGSVTSLRHHWTHPAFDVMSAASVDPARETEVEKARAWIERFAGEKLDYTFNRVMRAAALWVLSNGNTYEQDNSERYKIAEDAEWDEFWRRYEIVTGSPLDEKHKRSHFFTCSC